MSASSLPLTLPLPRERPSAPVSKPVLPVLGRASAPDVFVRLAVLSLGLHALAVAGAWLWPAGPAVTPAEPEPITLVALPPMAAPRPPVALPVAAPQPPRPVPPKPVPKPIVKPVAKPAPTPQPAPRPLAPADNEPAPSPNSHASAESAPTINRGPPSTESTESAPVAIDLGAAYRLNPAPEYPPLALRRGWQGTVRLRVALDPEGHPTQVSLAASSGYPMLDEAALAAVRHWHFRPATRLGKPVAATVEVPIVFRINR
ncbi:MAG: energy transducer TonB [Pseudomonadota bacterium]